MCVCVCVCVCLYIHIWRDEFSEILSMKTIGDDRLARIKLRINQKVP